MFLGSGSADTTISESQIRQILHTVLDSCTDVQRVLVIPPDYTRYHGGAGTITRIIWEHLGSKMQAVLPALGTHMPLTSEQQQRMFKNIPRELFADHLWRSDSVTIGTIGHDVINQLSEGVLGWSWPISVNRLLVEGNFDLIISIGQVVPHEVAGMSNYHKNILVGTGGAESIHKSHFLGAVYGIDRIIGRTHNPVRDLFSRAFKLASPSLPPILFVHTVVERTESGQSLLRGLYIGDDDRCFTEACSLSQRVNITDMDAPADTILVYLDPDEYRSIWLGNKAIYRSRPALAEQGKLLIAAPGVCTFGEDKSIDRLIRTYGYAGRERILDAVGQDPELQNNLSAAAHLIHGSTEGRFHVTYYPGRLSREAVQAAGYGYGNLSKLLTQYPLGALHEGWNTIHGERLYVIGNPASGLWRHRDDRGAVRT